jgi:hypothetical protein
VIDSFLPAFAGFGQLPRNTTGLSSSRTGPEPILFPVLLEQFIDPQT